MCTKKILIIGAGFLQTFVIKKAKEMGYYVLTVDGDENAPGFTFADEYRVIDITHQESCLMYAEEKKIDGVLTAATDFGVLTAAFIAKKMSLPGLSFQVAQTVKNKYLVRKVFCECEVDDTEQAFEVNANVDWKQLSTELHYPVMVKPCDGSGSRGASKVSDPSELKDACLNAIQSSVTHKAEIETFIEGKEYGVESFVEEGKIHVLAVMKKWMTKPPYYAELGHAIPSGLPKEIEKKIRMCVTNAIQALEINFGSVNMDVLVTEEGNVHIVDIGARMGGNLIGSHIIPLGTGIDYVANMIKASVREKTDFTPHEKGKCVVTRLLALTPGIVKKLPDFSGIAEKNQVAIYHHLQLGNPIHEYHTNLDGCGYIVVVSDDVEEAEQKAESVKQIVDKEIIRL